MKRDAATKLIEDFLQRIDAGDRYLNCIDEVWLFGSYARGALEPGDVDLNIEYTPDDDFREFQIRRIISGGDWLTPLRSAVVGRRHGLEVSFERRQLYAEKDFDLILLWRRGDDLDTGLARLNAIKPDPRAGRSERDAMLSAFEGIDRWVPLPVRQALSKQVHAGTLAVEQIELPAFAPENSEALEYVADRWQANSPLRRAGLAALAYIERNGGDPLAVHLHGRHVWSRDTPHYVGFKWRHFVDIPVCLANHDGKEWIEIVNPTLTKPLHAVRILPLDLERLRNEEF